MASSKNNDLLKLKMLKNYKNVPSEIRICKDGSVYIDGNLYNEKKSKYENLTVDIEKHNKMNTGEETQKIIKSSKKTKKGETVTIKDEKSGNRTETTTVKF